MLARSRTSTSRARSWSLPHTRPTASADGASPASASSWKSCSIRVHRSPVMEEASRGLRENRGLPLSSFAVSRFFGVKARVQPASRQAEVALDSAERHLQHRGTLLVGAAEEIAQLNKLGLTRIQSFQLVQRLVQFQGCGAIHVDPGQVEVQRNVIPGSTPLFGHGSAGVVGENHAHELSGEGVEMGAILPTDFALVTQAQVELVNQSRSLQGMVGRFAAKEHGGHVPQVWVGYFHQLLEGLTVSGAPSFQQYCYISGFFHRRQRKNSIITLKGSAAGYAG